jgi:glyoxylase-like metal-dependent hydrolase (beta-lactamase superfamily II)
VPHDAWWTAFRKFEVVYYSLYLGDLGRTEQGALDPVTLYTHRDLGNGVVQVWDYALGTTMVIERADKAVLIDTTMGRIGRDGGIFQYIRDHVLKNRNIDIEVFITHQHNDHIIGLASFVGAAQVKKIYVHREDSAPVIRLMGPDAAKVALVKDGDLIPFDGKNIEVIGVRGHTFGSLVMKFENFLFSGDSVGTGYVGISVISLEEYLDSLHHLQQRMGNGKYIVYGAHTGEVTAPMTDQYVRDLVDCVTRVIKGAIASPTYWRSNDISTRKVSAVRGSAITYDINNVHRIKGALRSLQISKGVLTQGYVPPVPAYVEVARGVAASGPAGFLAYISQYYATVDAGVATLDITPTVRDLEFRGLTVSGAPVRSGEAYHATLSVGENRFPIVVTAADGTTRTYSLLVVRNAP